MIEKIKHWREVFGLPNRTFPQNPSQEEVSLALKLIEEEFNELVQGCENRSLNEIADAIGDLYFVVTQMAMIHGLDPEEIVGKVYDSNMSKLCDDWECAADSIFQYKEKGMDVYVENMYDGRYIIKRSSDSKVLKGINFKEPVWDYD